MDFNIGDTLEVKLDTHKGKVGKITNIRYKLGENTMVRLRLEDNSEIQVEACFCKRIKHYHGYY